MENKVNLTDKKLNTELKRIISALNPNVLLQKQIAAVYWAKLHLSPKDNFVVKTEELYAAYEADTSEVFGQSSVMPEKHFSKELETVMTINKLFPTRTRFRGTRGYRGIIYNENNTLEELDL